jgi:hypothetical protein
VIASGSAFSALVSPCRPLLIALCTALAVGLAMANLLQMRGYIMGAIPFDQTTWDIFRRFWATAVGLPQR